MFKKHMMCREQNRTKSFPRNVPLDDRAATASDLVDAAAATREVTRRNAMVPILLDQTSDRICGFGGTSLSNRIEESSESRKNKTRRQCPEGSSGDEAQDCLLAMGAALVFSWLGGPSSGLGRRT